MRKCQKKKIKYILLWLQGRGSWHLFERQFPEWCCGQYRKSCHVTSGIQHPLLPQHQMLLSLLAKMHIKYDEPATLRGVEPQSDHFAWLKVLNTDTRNLIALVKPWKGKPRLHVSICNKVTFYEKKKSTQVMLPSPDPHTLPRQHRSFCKTPEFTHICCHFSLLLTGKSRSPHAWAHKLTGWDAVVLRLFCWISLRNIYTLIICGYLETSWGQRHANSQEQNIPMPQAATKKVQVLQFPANLLANC